MATVYVLTIVTERHGEDMKVDTNIFINEADALATLGMEFDFFKMTAPPSSMGILNGPVFTIRCHNPHVFIRGVVQGRVIP